MLKDIDRKKCLEEIRINIERKNIFSLRNAVLGLYDYSMIFLADISNHYPVLNIVKNLQLNHRIMLLVTLEPKLEKYNDVFFKINKLRNIITHNERKYEEHGKLLKLLHSLEEIEKFYEHEFLQSLKKLSAKDKFLQDLKTAEELVAELGKYENTFFYSCPMDYKECIDKLFDFRQIAEGINTKHDSFLNDKRVDLRDFLIILRNSISDSQEELNWQEAQIISDQIRGK